LQKDTEARCAKAHDEPHFGHKGHVNVDKDSKLITAFEVTVVNVHDSQVLPNVLSSPEDGGAAVYADSAYQSD